MNKKKVFHAFLLGGGLCLASLGTFTSCKDYADDITNLQTQIDNLNKVFAELQAQIKAGKLLKSVEAKDYGILVKLASGEEFKITNGAKGDKGDTGAQGIAGKNGTVWTISADGFWVKDGEKTEYKAIGKDGATGAKGVKGDKGDTGAQGVAGVYYVPNGTTGKFDKHIPTADGKEKVETTNISFLAPGTITAVKTDDVLAFYNVDGGEGEHKEVKIYLSNKLTSMVFNMSRVYEGMPAASINRYNYYGITLKAVKADADNSKDAPTLANEVTAYSPAMVLDYFLNPANAKIDAKKENFDFVAYNREYTRAAEENLGAQFTCADVKRNGANLTATVNYNGKENLKEVANDNAMTVLAMRYKSSDGANVVSNFAALKQYRYNLMYLNNANKDVKGATKASALQLTAAAAIKATPTFYVKWNAALDLDTCINTIRAYAGGNVDLKSLSVDKFFANTVTYRMPLDKMAKDGAAEKEGFTYKYELVGYEKDNVKQSTFAKLDGATLKPTNSKGEEGKQDAINKEPLVRVSLMHGKTVIAVGYAKIKINKTGKEEAPAIELTSDKEYKFNCGEDEVVLSHEFYEDIYEQLAAILYVSKAEAKRAYEIDLVNHYNAEGKKVNQVGKVSLDAKNINWAIACMDAYKAFVKGGKKEITTTIYFNKKANVTTDGIFEKVAVKLTWKPKTIAQMPVLDLDNYKNKSIWAKTHQEQGSGLDEIHINTTPYEYATGHNMDKMSIRYELEKALLGNKIDAKFTGDFEKFNKNFVVTYKFGKKEGLENRIDGDYSQLCYMGVTVAAINMKTGEIAYKNSHRYAQQLLNYNGGKRDLAKSLTLPVEVTAHINCCNGSACQPVEITIAHNKFNAVVLRPINLTDSSVEFVDAGNNTTANVNVAISDWRGNNVPSSAYKYFGIKDINLNTDEATTNMNGNVMKLKDVTTKLKLQYNKSGVDLENGKFGTVTYLNSDQLVADFEIYVPATITYAWGKLPFTVTVKIKKTAIK